MSGNYWLWSQLKRKGNVIVENGHHPLIVACHENSEYRIYSPEPSEYIVSVELVQKVAELGGNVISYPGWCQSSYEAKRYGGEHGVAVIPHGELFAMFS